MVYRKILEFLKKGKFFFEFEGVVIYYCGLVVRRKEDGWKVVLVGLMMSVRMN